MNTTRTLCAIVVLTGLGAAAHAEEALSRQQVRDQWAEAQRLGDVAGPGDTGLTLRELYPQRYPQAPAAVAKTRAEVKLELAQAARDGEISVAGEGQTLREAHPGRYPTVLADSGKTRAEVKLEVAAARRAGELVPAGEGPSPGERLARRSSPSPEPLLAVAPRPAVSAGGRSN